MLLFKLIQLLFENPVAFLIYLMVLVVPLLISISVHEWAHGFVAYKFGDDTPKLQGRLSLNPFAHLDLVGTLMLFIVGIGWAKPVEINPDNIEGRHKLMLVALAGPLSNFTLAVLFSFIIYLVVKIFGLSGGLSMMFMDILNIVVRINIVLAIFNMIPLPPLDGSNVVRNLIPENLSEIYFRIAPYGFPILLVLVFTGAVDVIFKLADFIQVYLLKWMALFFDPIARIIFKV